jgi:putative nucleotidyltransferase with HDIG domain
MRARDCRILLERWMREGSLDLIFPEVAALRGVQQPEEFHAEGDALIHTMISLDAVDDDADPRVFWGVLLHDIGKAATTEFIDGRWRSRGHAEEGAARVPAIMERIGFPELAADVAWLVRHHLFHFSWNLRNNDRLSKNQRKFMEHPLFPLLLEVCLADAAGSRGINDKGRKIMLIADLYVDRSAGDGPPGNCP